MDASFQQSLGAAACAARLRLCLTQAQVAKRAPLTSSIYGRVERGGTMLSVQTLLRLSAALEVIPDALLSQGGAGLARRPAPGYRRATGAQPRRLPTAPLAVRALALLRKLLDVADLELGQ
jgi:transcriptional regulator with XRE-family HTH domain